MRGRLLVSEGSVSYTLGELRRATRGIWLILAIALLLFFFMRPVGDWIIALFSK